MDLARRLGDEEQPAGKQDDVAPGKREFAKLNSRPRQAMIELSEASSSTRKINASDRPMARARCDRFASSRAVSTRDEHQVVDAEHDFERGQRQQRRPGIGIGQKCEHRQVSLAEDDRRSRK